MSDDVGKPAVPVLPDDEQGFLEELNRLRITAARRRGKIRLSLQDLAAASGVPKSTLANYLSGRTRMPVDVLDRLVLALGVPTAEAGAWAAAWERITDRALPPVASAPAGPGGHGLREIAAALRELTAIETDALPTEAGDPHPELLSTLDGLAKDLGEFGFALGELRDIAAQLQQDLYRQDAERRDEHDRNREQAAQLRLIREGLQAVQERMTVASATGGTGPGDAGAEAAGAVAPYRGLWPFREEQATLFHGRERLTAELTGRLEQRLPGTAVLVVTGASGAGKSSLVRAGLLPAIARGRLPVPGSADWPRLVLTPTASPLDELASQLASVVDLDAATVRDVVERQPRRVPLLARQAVLAHAARLPAGRRVACREQGRLVLVVDQFEELFTATDGVPDAERHRQAYLDALLAIARSDARRGVVAPALVVLVVRGDFLDRCAAYPELVPVLQDGQFVVGPMNREELRRAVTGPAAAAGLTLEDGLADELLAELQGLRTGGAASPGSALPLLSQAMLLTWQHREGTRLTRRGYGTTGGMSRVIAASAEEVYAGLTPRQRELAREIFRRMTVVTTSGGLSRRHVGRTELAQVAGRAGQAGLREVLDAFAGNRLVVLDRDGAEIAHDVLLHAWPRLHRWLDEERADRIVHGQLQTDAATWREHDGDPSFLYRGTQLASASASIARLWARPGSLAVLTEAERAFLDASEDAARRSTRIRRAITAGMIVLAVLAGVGAVSAVRYAVEADGQHRVALSRQLAAQGQGLSQDDPVAARRLAAAAWRIAPTEEAKGSMTALLTERPGLLVGHTDRVLRVAFSPDGRFLATAAADRSVRLWRVDTSDPQGRLLVGHTAAVNALAFSPDGRLLASAGDDLTVRLWDTATGRPVGQPLTGHTAEIVAIAFSADGTKLSTVGGGDDQWIRRWAISGGTPVGLPGVRNEEQVSVVAAAADGGRAVFVAARNGRLRLWRDLTGAPTEVAATAPGQAATAASSADGRTLATVGPYTGSVRLWDREADGRLVLGRTIDTVADLVVALSPDGRIVAVAGTDHVVRLWDTATGRPLGSPLTGHTGRVNALAFSPDGRLLATVGDDRTARLWNVETQWPAGFPVARGESYGGVAFSPDSALLAAGGGPTVQAWRTPTGALAVSPTQPVGPGMLVAFDRADGVLVAAPRGPTLRRTDPATGRSWPVALGGAAPEQVPLALSPDGALLLGTDDVGGARLWDTETGRLVGRLVDAGRDLQGVAFSGDGTLLAIAAGEDHGVRLWSTATGAPTGTVLTGHTRSVVATAFGPGNRLVATASIDWTVRLWDTATGRPVVAPLRHPGQVNAVAFSPDGRLLATGAEDGTVRLWDTATGSPAVEPLVGHTNGAWGVAISPDGRLLASSGRDGRIRLWNLRYLLEPARAICALVGPPSAAEWSRYARGESLPRVCD